MNRALIVKAVLAVLVIAAVIGGIVYKKKHAAVPVATQDGVSAPVAGTEPPPAVDTRYGNFTIPTEEKK